MSEPQNEIEIECIYYADCQQEEGHDPQWEEVRIGGQLTDTPSLAKLKEHLRDLTRKRKLEYVFGDEIIEVEHPRNDSVKSILERLFLMETNDEAMTELQELGNVLARKYLNTKYARTRLFMVGKATVQRDPQLFLLVADLESQFTAEYIDPTSHDFASEQIPNRFGVLKKGALYPVIDGDQHDLQKITVYEDNYTAYYPSSLECILKQSSEKEAKSLLNVIAKTCAPTQSQLADVVQDLRDSARTSFDGTELASALTENGISVDEDKVTKEWEKQFNYSDYTVSPDILSQDAVTVVITLDGFDIRCPLRYFPERVQHRVDGGYHYLTLRGREYSSVHLSGESTKINFASSAA